MDVFGTKFEAMGKETCVQFRGFPISIKRRVSYIFDIISSLDFTRRNKYSVESSLGINEKGKVSVFYGIG